MPECAAKSASDDGATATTVAAQRHGGLQSELGGATVIEWREPVGADADAHEVESRGRQAKGGGGRRQVSQLRPEARAPRGLDAAVQTFELQSVLRVVCVREVAEDAPHAQEPGELEPTSLVEEGRPVRLVGAVSAETGVELEMHGGRTRVDGLLSPGDGLELAEVAHPDVDAGLERRREVGARSCSHASTGASSPASRSANASARSATPSQVAPPSTAARATSTAPWP